MSELLSGKGSCSVLPDMEVEVLVGRLLSWWWKRFRRTVVLLLCADSDGAGLEAIMEIAGFEGFVRSVM